MIETLPEDIKQETIIQFMIDEAIKTSIAHLYFESIHPFEDGNGRIGRAIAESFNRPLIMNLSRTIEKNKKIITKH